MKICLISKYPPIQGGISAKTFWMAKGFAEIGIEIHVVTNGNCVEKEYFINDNPPETVPNLFIHFIDTEIPWHIPNSQLYISSLLDKTLEVIDKYQIDLLDTHYLIPYGIVGYLTSKIKGIPYIIRHGGSDISKFYERGIFKSLLENVIKDATAIITDSKNASLFKTNDSVKTKLPRYIPDEKYFKPISVRHEVPTFAFIGKINYYWKHKGLDKIVDLFSGIKHEYKLLFIGQGNGFNEFSSFVSQTGLESFEYQKFLHPVRIPDLLNNIDFLINFCQDSPIKDFSNIVCEALWSGVSIITDQTMDFDEYSKYIEIMSQEQIVKLDINNIKIAQQRIEGLIGNWNNSTRYQNKIKYGFDKYINENIEVYNGCLLH